MAEEVVNLNTGADAEVDRKKLKEERKRLKEEQKAQKKEAKQKARELSEQIAGDDEPGGISVFLVTVVIVVIWIAILCLLVKLDVGGFGSGVLAPVLKDVPVVNMILPEEAVNSTDEEESYGGYMSLREAVDYITELELELELLSSSGFDSDSLERVISYTAYKLIWDWVTLSGSAKLFSKIQISLLLAVFDHSPIK